MLVPAGEAPAAPLSPADVISVEELPAVGDAKSCRVVVPDDQLSLAIGKEGQNARLAAKLTGYKIDIKPQSYQPGEDEELFPMESSAALEDADKEDCAEGETPEGGEATETSAE